MFASFHAGPQARIGGCLLENMGEREGDGKGEEVRAGVGDARCQPPGR